MKKTGMTLIESVVTIAILGIIFLLVTPLIRSFGKVDSRAKTQKEIDSEFLVINEFLQEKIRASKSNSGKYAEVFDADGNTVSRDGIELRLEIPISDTSSDSVKFFFESNNFVYEENEVQEILMEGIEEGNFGFHKGIITYYINYDVGIKKTEETNPKEIEEEKKYRSSLRGSASTRIDIQ